MIKSLDLSGEKCPMTLLKTKRWLAEQQWPARGEITVSGASEQSDVERYLTGLGYVLSIDTTASGQVVFYFSKETQVLC